MAGTEAGRLAASARRTAGTAGDALPLQCRPGAGRPPPLHPIVRETRARAACHERGRRGAPAPRRGQPGGRCPPMARRVARGPGPAGSRRRAAVRRARRLHRVARVRRIAASALDAMTRRDERLADGAGRRRGDRPVVRVRPLRRPPAGPDPRSRRARSRAPGARRGRGVRRRRRAAGPRDPAPDARRRHRAEDEVAAARALWDAFRAPEPHALDALPQGTVFGAAARRHLQQFPWTGDGLNRSERRCCGPSRRRRHARRGVPRRPARGGAALPRRHDRVRVPRCASAHGRARAHRGEPRDPGRRARVGRPAGALARRRPPAGGRPAGATTRRPGRSIAAG